VRHSGPWGLRQRRSRAGTALSADSGPSETVFIEHRLRTQRGSAMFRSAGSLRVEEFGENEQSGTPTRRGCRGHRGDRIDACVSAGGCYERLARMQPPRRFIRVRPGPPGALRRLSARRTRTRRGRARSADSKPLYGARSAVPQTTRRGRREIRSCSVSPASLPAGSPAAWAGGGGLPRASPQSLPAVKRTRRVVRS
jgi:hypothetical protein